MFIREDLLIEKFGHYGHNRDIILKNQDGSTFVAIPSLKMSVSSYSLIDEKNNSNLELTPDSHILKTK